MALLGLSLILASVVLVCIRRPAWFTSLFADPTRPAIAPSPDRKREEKPPTDGFSDALPTKRDESGLEPTPSSRPESDQNSTPPVLRVIEHEPALTPSLNSPGADLAADDAQTTPKASPAAPSTAVPAFALSAPEPAPTAAAPAPAPSPPASSLMPPPPRPRPPTLRPLPPASSASAPLSAPSLAPPPRPRPSPTPARGPGCSTLAPPPTTAPTTLSSAATARARQQVVLTPGHSPLDWARLANSPHSDLRGLPRGTPYLRVTPSMLKKQTGRRGKDAWSVLGGRVYNLSPYLPFHPGGEAELLRGAGRDGTRLFGEVHPWVNYEGMLAACLVGVFVSEEEGDGNGGGKGAGEDMEAMD